jgi:hypothetical protein
VWSRSVDAQWSIRSTKSSFINVHFSSCTPFTQLYPLHPVVSLLLHMIAHPGFSMLFPVLATFIPLPKVFHTRFDHRFIKTPPLRFLGVQISEFAPRDTCSLKSN